MVFRTYLPGNCFLNRKNGWIRAGFCIGAGIVCADFDYHSAVDPFDSRFDKGEKGKKRNFTFSGRSLLYGVVVVFDIYTELWNQLSQRIIFGECRTCDRALYSVRSEAGLHHPDGGCE